MTASWASEASVPHVIELQQGENVRDLGGYATADGNTTRSGHFLRSGDMANLTREDMATLTQYGVTTVIDLRMHWEIEAAPNVFTDHAGVQLVLHDFWGDRFDDYRSPERRAAPQKKLADLYCAGLEQSAFVMADIMATLADAEGAVAFHCRSGKDRTGLVAALLLALAGVPPATICDDFALTSRYLSGDAINPIEATAPGQWQRLCEPETMAMTLAYLHERHGGAEGYLSAAGVGGTTLERLRQKLLG